MYEKTGGCLLPCRSNVSRLRILSNVYFRVAPRFYFCSRKINGSEMHWVILFFAGMAEVAMTFCLGKTRTATGTDFYLWGAGFLASLLLSMMLLAKAVQSLPIGTAYAVWTGIGAVGSVVLGILVFQESASPLRLFFLFTLIASLIGLKMVS